MSWRSAGSGGWRVPEPKRQRDFIDAYSDLMGWCVLWFTLTVILAALLLAGTILHFTGEL